MKKREKNNCIRNGDASDFEEEERSRRGGKKIFTIVILITQFTQCGFS